MVGKKKKTKATPRAEIELSPKVKKADELRKLANKEGSAMLRIVNKWQEALNGVSSSSERKRIDEKYKEQLSACERVHDKRYTNYYNYVEKNFTTQEIIAAGALGKFMDKSFINNLEKNRKKRK